MPLCRICNTEKPAAAFYKSRLSRCKDCVKAKARAYYAEHREKVLDYKASPQGKAVRRAYRKRRAEFFRAWSRAYSAANGYGSSTKTPEQVRAHNRVQHAMRTGRMKRPDACEICGTDCKPHGHHPDYSQPLLVVWVCPECHGAIHCQTTVNATR